ncbi:MAG: hypothetical protein JW703_02740 [Candidatus Diapherotrites archaeon]|nr:hypothetical protein [Candidatus Diapherotrites archaeon]
MRSKIWGLKKLRAIHNTASRQGIKLNSTIIPWKVYSSPAQVRETHFLKAERLLIRSDLNKTKARQTQNEWSSMTRTDGKPTQKDARKKINKILRSNKEEPDLQGKKTRIIMHPTKTREQISYSCTINFKGNGKIEILIRDLTSNTKHSNEEKVHRFMPAFIIPLEVSENKIISKNYSLFHGKKGTQVARLLENAVSFLNHGIQQKQIKIEKNNKPFELSFVSFKGTETIPEFYDFLEETEHNLDKEII